MFLLLFLLAFAARLTIAGVRGFDQPRFGDWEGYVAAAKQLVSSGTYPDRTNALFFRPPGYAFFLALATLGHPGNIAIDKTVGAAAGSLVAPLLALLSLRLFRRRGLAIATGAAGALHPSFVLFSSDVESETIFIPLLLGFAALLLAAADRRASRLAFLAGIALGAAALTRPSALALAPLLAAPLFDRRSPPRPRGRLAGLAILGFALALSPWIVRNLLHFGELIPVSDEGGCAFFDGNSDWANRLYELKDQREVESINLEMHRDKVARLVAAGIGPGTKGFESPSRRSMALVRSTLEERRRDPAGTARLFVRKLWHWIRPYPILFWSLPVIVSASALYVTLYVLAAVGLATAKRRGAVRFSIAVMALSTVLHVLVLVLWRYRVPYWDPILLLYGAFGFTRFLPRGAQVEAA
ncbi:MAG TPA: glycosyltransferase family 39 protein [Thermoanaerobaculia bacterium]